MIPVTKSEPSVAESELIQRVWPWFKGPYRKFTVLTEPFVIEFFANPANVMVYLPTFDLNTQDKIAIGDNERTYLALPKETTHIPLFVQCALVHLAQWIHAPPSHDSTKERMFYTQLRELRGMIEGYKLGFTTPHVDAMVQAMLLRSGATEEDLKTYRSYCRMNRMEIIPGGPAYVNKYKWLFEHFIVKQ